jgi:hypothetical protein
LQLRSVGGAAYGTVSQLMAPTATAFTVSGAAHSSGRLEEAVIAVQAFDESGKQVAWQTLADARGTKEWTAFKQTVTLPARTTHWNLIVTLRGEGGVWLDDVKIEAALSVFLEE